MLPQVVDLTVYPPAERLERWHAYVATNASPQQVTSAHAHLRRPV